VGKGKRRKMIFHMIEKMEADRWKEGKKSLKNNNGKNGHYQKESFIGRNF
jgi:hypothetical protein